MWPTLWLFKCYLMHDRLSAVLFWDTQYRYYLCTVLQDGNAIVICTNRHPTMSVKALCFRLSRLSVRLVWYCYHDISWTAWTILIKLTGNIQQPQLMTWLDAGGQRLKVKVTAWAWFKYVRAKASTPTLGRGGPSSSFCCFAVNDFVR